MIRLLKVTVYPAEDETIAISLKGITMRDETPKIPQDNKGYNLLRDRRISDFNNLRSRGELGDDYHGLAFRGSDLRGLDARGLDFSNCKFKQADLRGINFSNTKLDGASIYSSKISGCLFPKDLKADEIMMSVQQGTRLRIG